MGMGDAMANGLWMGGSFEAGAMGGDKAPGRQDASVASAHAFHNGISGPSHSQSHPLWKPRKKQDGKSTAHPLEPPRASQS